jgi:putative ABC transport system permease protein
LFGDPNSLVQSPSAVSQGAQRINFDTILGDTSIRNAYSEVDPNAWNFLLVKTSPSASVLGVQKSLRAYLTQQGLDAAVSDWSWGAGPVATLALSLQLIFNIIIFIILVVAVIIIMNTLVISVTERIGEIGTIRAIGGGKPFIRKMIVWETLTLSITAGLGGVVLGTLLIGIINGIGIQSSNVFFEILFGGTTLRPIVSFGSVFWSLVSTVGIGVLSSLYPTAVALRISPVRAMQKN